MSEPALFDEPERPTLGMSKHYDDDHWQLSAGRKVRYTPKSYKRFMPCDECQWFKHEQKGKSLPYRQVAHQRTLITDSGNRSLLLCHFHTHRWREIDGKD